MFCGILIRHYDSGLNPVSINIAFHVTSFLENSVPVALVKGIVQEIHIQFFLNAK